MARPTKPKAQAKGERDNGPKWNDGIPALVRSLAGRSKKGLTDQEIADTVGCAVRTIHRWKDDHPEFLAALLETKAIMNARVEMSIYQRAIGYRATKVEVTTEGGVETKRVVKTEDVAPDVTAGKFWLTCRDPANWKEKQTVEHSGEIRIEDARATLLSRIRALVPDNAGDSPGV
jgi:hypothetical protein